MGVYNIITKAAVGLLCISAAAGQRAQVPAAGMVLEIPELHIEVRANDSTVLPSGDISYFQIRIPSRAMNAGTIHSRINTESANIIMTIVGTQYGTLCKFDLSNRGGVEISPGRNSVEIEYRDLYQRSHYASYLLIMPGETEAALPPPRAKPLRSAGATYALIVGISKYEHAGFGLTNLKYADSDARAFFNFLTSPAGGTISKENVLLLLNEDATLENLQRAIEKFLTRPAERDTVLIFLAGHGDPDPEGKLYFLTYDADPERLAATAFPMAQLQQVYQQVIRARRIITFADSCHSFGLSGQNADGGHNENNLINQYLRQYASEGERDVITASNVSEISNEDDRWGHGVFTYFLLQGLEGKAADSDGNVTVGQLFQYVRQQVRHETGNKQNPQMANGSAAGVPLSGPLVRVHQR